MPTQPITARELTPNELRLGNWVKHLSIDKSTWYETQIEVLYDRYGYSYINPYTHDGIEDSVDLFYGVELTPEWLERFGFEYHDGFRDSYYNDVIEVYDNPTEIGCQVEGFFGTSLPAEYCRRCVILYVHQLQNLYFALTGEELKIEL